MRVTFNYCNLACYVYENKAIYNPVKGSQFPESDLHVLQSGSNNNFNHTPSRKVAVWMKWSPNEKCFDPSQILSIIALRNNIVGSFWRICLWMLGLVGLCLHWTKTPVLHAFSFFSLPTSYCNLSEKSCSFNRPFHMVIVNMIVANKSYSNVFVVRVLGPCDSLTLTELICQSCQLTARQR